MWATTILDILKPPKVIELGATEKPDYNIVIIGTVSIVVVAVVVFILLKRK